MARASTPPLIILRRRRGLTQKGVHPTWYVAVGQGTVSWAGDANRNIAVHRVQCTSRARECFAFAHLHAFSVTVSCVCLTVTDVSRECVTL